MNNTTAIIVSIATAVTLLCSATRTSAQAPETDPQAWYATVRAELVAALEETLESRLENMAQNDVPAGQQAQVTALVEATFRGTIANLDAEINGIGERVRAEAAEHDPQEENFCSPGNAGLRLLERVREDPADAQNALLAGVQCRTAYRGAVSRPTTEEIESLRDLCFIARDRIVEHYDNPEIVFEPDRAAVYAIGRCADYRGAAWVADTLTGSDWYRVWSEADEIVRSLTSRLLRGEFLRP